MAGVGNLGGYQIITTLVKRLGGPTKAVVKAVIGLAFSVAGGGAIGYAVGEKHGEKKAIEAMKPQTGAIGSPAASEGQARIANGSEYLVSRAATSSDGTAFSPGDRLRVMDSDGDAVMVERVGDDNSPYWVSRAFLLSVAEEADKAERPE